MSKVNKMYILSLALAFLASGCIVRTYEVVKDRPDIEIKGNQGYLAGVPSEKKEVENKTRTTYVTEIELGASHEEQVLVEQHRQAKAAKKSAKQKTAKQTKVSNSAAVDKKDVAAVPVSAKKEDTVVVVGQQPVVSAAKEKVKKASTYVVKSGDTLEKIAARPEVYGDKKQWYKIFKANESKLKEPNKILPGQVLDIP
ncbi:MAG: LysM peptidoglycan-binding domain-containing protein [Candidatus Omnitrophica bacterium]|nr:LysM peptidoglycan-binding domain-containing protein [Candidatus Omnitrophota bacterium]